MRSLSLLLLVTGVAMGQTPTLEQAWKDLANADETKATRAALSFAANPKESVAFLKSHLRPVKVEPKQVSQWVDQLGDQDFATREKAQQELEYLGKYAKGELESASKGAVNEEIKTRLGKLLGRIEAEEKEEKLSKEEAKPVNPFGGGGGVSISSVNGVTQIRVNGKLLDLTPKVIEKLPPSVTWQRAARAIGVLEFLGTPEAVTLLEQIALGEDNAMPTKQAADALARLKRKK